MSVMTETTNAATKAKTAKHIAFPFGLPMDEVPNFDLPRMEVPEAFRELADKGVAQAKDNYEKIRRAAEEMNVILEKTYSTTTKGVADYNLKLFEMARANTDAAFEFASGLIAMRSLPEMVERSTEQVRKQFDLAAAQSKELWALAEKMATETAEPIKTGLSGAFNKTA
jgi:phasin